jgi:uncharacterized protein YodC (DUF2158 family)
MNTMQTLPKVGEPAYVAGISFPLIVESFSQETRSASLKGEHPESGVQVHLPSVCLTELHAVAHLAAGDTARLKSGGPAVTVANIEDDKCEIFYWNKDKCDFASWENVPVSALEKTEVV